MRIGINTPVLTRHPGMHSPWERAAGIEDVARIATAADLLGFDHLTCGEHVAVPADFAADRGDIFWDPLATFGYLAARTQQIRLTTMVLVLGHHHPLEIAKRYGTLDRVSGGRLILGVGVGCVEQEFALLGAHFGDRGSRADDTIAAVRSAWGVPTAEYHGIYHDFADFVVQPTAAQVHVPMWVGGRTQRSLRRAITHCEGWAPLGLELDEVERMLGSIELPSQFDVVIPTSAPLDPIEDPNGVEKHLLRLQQAGATAVTARLAATSAGHYCQQLEALAGISMLIG